MYPVKQSTALTVPFFVHDASGDAVTGLTDGSFTKRISKNGGSFAAMTVTISEMENGWYSIPLSTAHSDTLGLLTIVFTNAGSKQVNLQFRVHARLPDDLAYPTTSGRSIDVAATGEVGLDFGNATGSITGGELGVGAFAAGAITAAAIATDAVDADALATDAVNEINATVDTALADFFTSSAQLVDDIWDELITGAAHNTNNSAGKRLRLLAEAGSYAEGAVWLDTVNGTAGTTDFENGTEVNPVDTIASANTIATSVGITRFRVLPGSSVTFAATQANEAFVGENWTLALGGQNIAGTYFEGAKVSGVGSGTGTTQTYMHCIVDTATHVKGTIFRECAILGTQTINEAGDYRLAHCYSGVAGAGAPTIDMGAAIGASTLELRGWSGGITLNNLAAGDVVTLDGIFGTITLNGADAQVEIRGTYKGLTNNLTGSPTVNDAAANLNNIETDTNSLNDTKITQTLNLTASGNIGIDWANVENPTTALDLSGTDIQLVDTTTTNTDMRGTDNAALASVCTEARLSELDAATAGKAANQIDIIQTDTTTDIPALIAALNDLSAAQVNSEVSDVIKTDTITLPGQTAPPLAPTMEQAVSWLYKAFRNRKAQTATQWSLYADNETTIDSKATVSDDGTTAIKQEVVSGP